MHRFYLSHIFRTKKWKNHFWRGKLLLKLIGQDLQLADVWLMWYFSELLTHFADCLLKAYGLNELGSAQCSWQTGYPNLAIRLTVIWHWVSNLPEFYDLNSAIPMEIWSYFKLYYSRCQCFKSCSNNCSWPMWWRNNLKRAKAIL